MLQTLYDLPLAVWVRESPSLFAYTLVLSLHAIGLAIVLGVNTLVALRLLGVAPGIPVAVLPRLYGAIWVGFAINAISGLMLFTASTKTMGTMPAFWIKLGMVASGMIVALRLKARHLDGMAASGSVTVPPGARAMAWLSLVIWYLTLVVGRLTGYPDLISSWFGSWASGL